MFWLDVAYGRKSGAEGSKASVLSLLDVFLRYGSNIGADM